ncbi:MAG: molybdenum cofactor guanylyltransferase [Acidobacteriaceae bacterium]|nr:molybdenum cofactor guanylyltransferase [Acidobacteriaceae bacterium]
MREMTAGFVLVGGHSSRMGRDKALLPGRSRSWVEELASRVEAAAGNVALVGMPQRYAALGLECMADLRPGLGPLAGIEAALQADRAELNLIVACDMPDIETSWLIRLLDVSKSTAAACVATRDSVGVTHPLCAVYRKNCLAKVQSALNNGRLSVHELLGEMEAIFLDSEETISNVNTPEEWKAWQMRREATQAR